uniref:Olfactory receptor 2Z1 n=1 Tax=Castor canadensis TaxID=51338 RepID=A0A8B7UWK2_CASCN|nr:olfactory receptor 2Z1 [Castor canadensis]
MGMSNQSVTSDFILMGLLGHTGPHLALFFLVAAMLTVGLLGNTSLLFLILMECRLHTPMYFLLSQLSLLDIGFPLVTIPKVAAGILQGENSISFGGCAAQMFILMLMGVSEGILLSLMSYDHYVAVCHPLHYPMLMRRQVCVLMVATCWGSGVLVASVQTSVTLHFPFCASHTVEHFFCELPALLKLACADTRVFEMSLSISGVLILLLPVSLIVTSYGLVLATVVRLRSAEARHKAFTTCSSHVTVVGLFYGAAVFVYMVPGTYHSPPQDSAASLFYSLVTPMLNPLIYSLRNRDVRVAVTSVLSRAGFRPKR